MPPPSKAKQSAYWALASVFTLPTFSGAFIIPPAWHNDASRAVHRDTSMGLTTIHHPRHHALPRSVAASSSSSMREISSNEDLMPGMQAIDAHNADLFQRLEDLQQAPYFRFFSVDILASCEYMPQELVECYSQTCEIYPVDEDEVPTGIKSVDEKEHDFELDGFARWDMPSDDYYDTLEFPEDYTGYDGREVWNFIHDRICFADYAYDDNHWKADFNKAVSGVHALISAQVVRGIVQRVASSEGFAADEKWTDPPQEFARRLGPSGETPMALENLYFTFMLMLTAVKKARNRLLADCASGKIEESAASTLQAVLSSPLLDEAAVDVASHRLHDHAVVGDAGVSFLWEARMRSRELLRIMNCVQCNKCRLHGKISMMGLSTALQILVGFTGEGVDPKQIHRVELAALMTTLQKCSHAVKFCREMMEKQ